LGREVSEDDSSRRRPSFSVEKESLGKKFHVLEVLRVCVVSPDLHSSRDLLPVDGDRAKKNSVDVLPGILYDLGKKKNLQGQNGISLDL
jgi:hypothetical protein